MVNRLIFADDSEGMALVRAIRDRPGPRPPVMLVSNFADAQQAAVEAGAQPGFGKAELDLPQTHARLDRYLPPGAAAKAG